MLKKGASGFFPPTPYIVEPKKGFYVNCWGEVKVLTPIYYLVWFSFRRQFLPFRGRLMSLLRLTPCGVSSRPLLSQECQNYLRNDCLFFPLYPTRIFIFLY